MDRELGIALGKVILAASWADGILQEDEISLLNDFLGKVPGLTDQDWWQVYLYAEYPVEGEEAQSVLANFQTLIDSKEKKESVLAFVDGILRRSRNMRTQEKAFYLNIKSEVEAVSTGRLSRILKGGKGRKSMPLAREAYLEDYLNNLLYFRFLQSGSEPWPASVDETSIRLWCLEIAMMVAVFRYGGAIPEGAKEAIISLLQPGDVDEDGLLRLLIDFCLAEDPSRFSDFNLGQCWAALATPEQSQACLQRLGSLLYQWVESGPTNQNRLRQLGKAMGVDAETIRSVLSGEGAQA